MLASCYRLVALPVGVPSGRFSSLLQVHVPLRLDLDVFLSHRVSHPPLFGDEAATQMNLLDDVRHAPRLEAFLDDQDDGRVPCNPHRILAVLKRPIGRSPLYVDLVVAEADPDLGRLLDDPPVQAETPRLLGADVRDEPLLATFDPRWFGLGGLDAVAPIAHSVQNGSSPLWMAACRSDGCRCATLTAAPWQAAYQPTWHVGCHAAGMAVIAPLIAFIGRQLGRLVQLVFGWASVLLFGRVPQSKQLLLAGVALGSILWIVTIVGVLVPDVGAFLIAFVPAPDFISDDLIRLVMLVLALILPLGVGAAGLFLMDESDRPTTMRGKALQVLRGYPYAAVLSFVILFLVFVAPAFKVRSIVKRWKDAHIPIVIKPGAYEQVTGELEAAVDGAGLELSRARAPRVLEAPSRLLAAVGGESVRRLVPDQLVMLRAPSIEITVHPSDVAIAGSEESVARSRAAVADRLTRTEAYLTTTEEAQQIEDALRELRDPSDPQEALRALPALDERLSRLTVPYEEWEVLYRQRLQVERDLLRGRDRATDGPPRNERVLRLVR